MLECAVTLALKRDLKKLNHWMPKKRCPCRQQPRAASDIKRARQNERIITYSLVFVFLEMFTVCARPNAR
jgi:hypothetical protein